jgi:hypothetical protein
MTTSRLRSAMAWLPSDLPWRAIGTGAAGAALVVAGVLVAGLFRSRDGDVGALESRLAQAEQQLRDVAGRAPAPTVIPKIVDDLANRIATLDAAVASARPAATDPALINRIATLEGAIKALDEKIGVASRRSDDASVLAREAHQQSAASTAALTALAQKVELMGAPGVGQGDLDALTSRIATLERAIKTLESKLAKPVVAEAADPAVRLAMTAAALSAAAARGDAFAAELAAAKALGTDARALAPLEPFATTGVPAAAALGRELLALMPALTQAAGAVPRDSGFLERLQANAERLVRIRPIDETPGDDPAAVLARIEVRAAQSDLAGALAELGKLSAPARLPAQAWIAKTQARAAAIAASRQFAADTLAVLGKPPEVR